jgi:ferrochelatase
MADEKYSEYELIFSAHGLPQKIVDRGDVYQKHVIRHVDILKDMMNKKDMNFSSVHIAYQSKVGPMAWLTPSLDEKLEELKGKKVAIFPIAFTIDNSETDFELEIEYREIAEEIGIADYRVARCPNDSDLFVDALDEIYHKMR